MLVNSCSTKKKTWISRQYHNTTARYNGYYNGSESIKYGIKKIHNSFVDDYSTVLPVFRTGNLKKAKSTLPYMDKAIQKGSIVIQKHSIKIRGKEYCRWIDDNYLMVGKAYFYKGEFDEAAKTFSFITEEYKKSLISYEAYLWLSRCYIEKGDYASAESILMDLNNNKFFPKQLKKDHEIINADLYIRQKNYPLAKTALIQCFKKYKLRKDKARLNYIVAQIYQYNEDYKKAAKHYTQVLKSNAEYIMVFNSKMNLALCSDKSSTDSDKMRKELVKMSKDDKNIDYLDQIYYTIAQMDLLNEDTVLAKENYLNSTVYSVSNESQKALSFLELAKIDFAQADFISSQLYYDSTIYFMSEDFRLYKPTLTKYLILTDLVNNLKTIQLQDSLISLALTPQKERDAIIKAIIDKEVEKERIEKEKEILKRQNLYEGNTNRNRNEQFGNNTSGGKWYFYNPATLSFGLSEFRKKWGKRKLEDDWRRKNRKTTVIAEEDSSSLEMPTTNNTKDPSFYLKQLPSTSEDFLLAREKIANAYYEAAIIYRHDLLEINKSNEMFNKILELVDIDSLFFPMTYYNLYLNYSLQENTEKSNLAKSTLLKYFSKSVYAKILEDPDYIQKISLSNNNNDSAFEEVFVSYKGSQYNSVIDATKEIKNNEHKDRYRFIRAVSMINTGDTAGSIKILAEVAKAETPDLATHARKILDIIKDPTSVNESNRRAIENTPYKINHNSQHLVMFIAPKEGVDISYLKTLISDFNTKNYSTQIFEVNAMMIGLDMHLLMVKYFEGKDKALKYHEDIVFSTEVTNELQKTEHHILPITTDNFQEFYVNKDLEGYSKFFKEKYLDKN
jgi:hypothetical protein